MVDADAGQFVEGRRADAVTPAAVVLTADAVVLVTIAVVGLPFLVFFFGDETGGWGLWPFVVGWVAAVALGGAATAAAVRFAGYGNYDGRRVGVAASAGTGAAGGIVLAASFPGSPLVALAAAALTVVNAAAALVLINPERAGALVGAIGFGRPAPAIDDLDEAGEADDDFELTDLDESGRSAKQDEFETESDRAGTAEAAAANRNRDTVEVAVAERDKGAADAAAAGRELNAVDGVSGERDSDEVAPVVAGRNRDTVDVPIGASRAKRAAAAVLRRPARSRAALHTLGGVRLPRRAARR